MPRRVWAMVAMMTAIVMAVLDSTIANVALPSIAADLGASPAASIWIINAYLLAVVIFLLPLASLGEIVGFRRISQAGLVLFTIASLACAFAPNLPLMSLARVAQGIGAAAIMSVNGAMVRYAYPQVQLGRAVGIVAMTTALSSALGPTVASGILALGSWHWLFGVNVPLGVFALLIGLRTLPLNPRDRRPLNWTGAALYALTIGLMITGLEAFSRPGAHGVALLQIVAAGLFGTLLVLRESRRVSPLVPIDLLSIPIFSLSLLTSICSFAAQMLALVALPFDLQHRLGYSAAETGLLLTPWPVAVAIAAPIAGRLADRFPAAILGGIGLAVMAGGLILLAVMAPGIGHADIAWRMAVCGIGFGLFQAPNNRILLGSAPRPRAGAAGGMLGTARQVGQSLGAVGVALCFRLAPSSPTVWAVSAAAAAAGLAATVSMTRLLPRPR